MKSLKRLQKKVLGLLGPKGFALGLVIFLAGMALLTPIPTEAIFGKLIDIGYNLVSKLAFGISWIASVVAGVIIAFESWAIEVVLNANTQIVNSTPVRLGFPIALSITNLGFVAAIIVIAIATILRLQNYGIKQMLTKLIAAALLVNFSLVFAGAILNFADQLTLYFLNQINPGGKEASFNSFASSMAGAFNPQRSFLEGSADEINNLNAEQQEALGGAMGAEVGKMLLPITSIVFVNLSLGGAIITLGVFIFMLMVRYVTIGILLILMPLAWLTWIFPIFGSSLRQWWSAFLKQAFFAPIVVFFLYLAIMTSASLSTHTDRSANISAFANPNNKTYKDLSGFFAGVFGSVATNTLQQIMVIGIMLGGLYSSQKLSITGANAGMKTFDKWKGKATTGVAMWTGKKIRSGAHKIGITPTAMLNRVGTDGKTTHERMREKAATMTGVRGWLASKGAEFATRTAIRGGERRIKEAEDKYNKENSEVLQAKFITASDIDKAAIMKILGKRKDLDGLNINVTHTDKMKNTFEKLGMAKDFEDLEKSTMINLEMANLMRKGASTDDINKAAEKFFSKFSKQDVASAHVNEVFSGKAKFGLDEATLRRLSQSVAHGVAIAAPTINPNLMSRMKSGVLKNYEPTFRRVASDKLTRIGQEKVSLVGSPGHPATPPVGMSPADITRRVRELDRSRDELINTFDNFKKSLARNATGLGGGATGGGATGP